MLKKIVLIFCFTFMLSSCADRKEIDDYAYVIAVGIDKAENNMYNFTFSLANINSIGETKKERGGNMSSVSAVARDFYTAMDDANNNVSKKINLAHTKLIVFSESAAKSDMPGFVDSFVRELKIRPGTILAVSENSEEYLENLNPLLEINPEKYFKEIFQSDNTDYAVRATLGDFFCSVNDVDKTMILPYLTVEKKDGESGSDKQKNKSSVCGSAYFKKGKMVGKAENDESISRILLSGKAKRTAYDMNVNNSEVTLMLTQNRRPKITVSETAQPKIKIKLYSDCEVVYVSHEAKNKLSAAEIKIFAAESIKQSVTEYLLRSVKEYNADLENFSEYAKRKFNTYAEWKNYNWNEKYKNAVFDVEVEMQNISFGILKGE